MKMTNNLDKKTVSGFGDEWERFDQSKLTDSQALNSFQNYFSIFPWDILPDEPKGFDLGCGSGRWAKFVAPEVKSLYCIDPSSALDVARNNLKEFKNCFFLCESVDNISLEDSSMDFGYSLGVLHHIPDTQQGIRDCVRKLKPNAPFLLYLYYAFDSKPFWFKLIWKISDLLRAVISRFPYPIRYFITQLIALLIYWPLARLSLLLQKLRFPVSSIPLNYYKDLDFYWMRTDALDRFGTRLEKRFTKKQIEEMMKVAGLERIKFSSKEPFWCAVGYRSVDG
jgi:SAM-dependent methyltransferase